MKLVVRTRQGKKEFDFNQEVDFDVTDSIEFAGITLVVDAFVYDKKELVKIQAVEKDFYDEENSIPFAL